MKIFNFIWGMLLLAGSSVLAQPATGILQGRILTAGGSPAANSTVQIQHTGYRTKTDEQGKFRLEPVPAGRYVLLVSHLGYTALKKNVSVSPGKTPFMELQLSESKLELSEITVNGTKNAYNVTQSATATRMDIPLLETPQSVQIVPAEVMRQRQAFTLNELAGTFTGLKANNGNGSFSMRGFTAYSPNDASFLLYNGVRGNLFLWSQQPLLYNVEAVELLRGPSGALFSEGAPGGVINFITKKPEAERRYGIELSAGSWKFYRASADFTGPLTRDKKLLYRVIAGYDRSNSFRFGQEKQNFFFAPSLTYVFSERSLLNLEVNYARQRAVHQYDNGSFIRPRADGTFDFNYYPEDLTVQSPTDYGRTANSSATLTFNHALRDNLKLTVVQRAVRNVLDYTDHIPVGKIMNDSISRGYQDWETDRFSLQTTAYVSYRAKTGILMHTLVAGADYNRYGWTRNDYQYKASGRMSILRPDYSNDIPGAAVPAAESDDNKRITNLAGAYIQDQVDVGRQLKLLLSLRYDQYDATETPLSARDNKQGDELQASGFIPRAGLVYLPFAHVSFYGTYLQSFNPQTSNHTLSGGPFPTRQATQYELGAKADLLKNQLSATVSAYQIDYSNVLTAAPTDENSHRQAAIDGTRSTGLEVSLTGKVGNLNIIAGYAYNRHVLRSTSSYGKEGDRFPNAPGQMANAWLRYQLPPGILNGLALAAGMRYVGDQAGLLSNQQFVFPAYTVFDAAIDYGIGRYSIRFNAFNLANRHYFTGSRSGVTTGGLGDPFNLRLGLNYQIK
ncbi:TonB-dependent siderophore receptor [Pedobacter yulinensis]|uniref:TonB-dependent siderophore receptor n=1 Tax=Pedobacter yulinensis TaxID=2126353 RepID=A0A2T3HHZ2_9SPHI|nr:TonB-dependent receptor [Pedobacter yulinensis]PST82064.1 TonB-dependent siderophore receptor [Pedobacter yulinensis]